MGNRCYLYPEITNSTPILRSEWMVRQEAQFCESPAGYLGGFQVFRGSQIARVDDKNRLKVPAEFKRLLDEQKVQTFFITSFDGERAEIFPMPEWEKIEAEMAGRSSSPEKTRFLDVTNYYGQVVEMDAAGRLLLPQNLREKAGLKGDLAVLGLQTRLAVINDQQHQAKLKAAPLTGSDIGALAIPGL